MTTRKKHRPTPLMFSGRAHLAFSRRLAKAMDWELGNMELATFSDQETQVIVREKVAGKDVFLVQPTSAPANEHLMELLMMAAAVKNLRPARITAVMPFVGYRRQEKVTQDGEVLSFELMARLLKTVGISRVLTIDLHKHRSTKFFKLHHIVPKELRAFPVLSQYFLKKKLTDAVCLAPDKGALPESERYARYLGIPLMKASKHRARRDEVVIDHLEGDVAGKDVIIVDDEINTAGTLVSLVDILKKKYECRRIFFACTHGVLSGAAIERLEKSPIEEVVMTDTIALPPEKRIAKMKILSVVPLFAAVLQKWTHESVPPSP